VVDDTVLQRLSCGRKRRAKERAEKTIMDVDFILKS